MQTNVVGYPFSRAYAPHVINKNDLCDDTGFEPAQIAYTSAFLTSQAFIFGGNRHLYILKHIGKMDMRHSNAPCSYQKRHCDVVCSEIALRHCTNVSQG